MKILLLGSGGREHALAWKIAQSPKVEKLYIAPGNAGTTAVGENVNIKATDFEAISAFALKEDIAMVVVGPEDPLVKESTTTSRTAPNLNTSLLSVPPHRELNWKEARNLQKAS